MEKIISYLIIIIVTIIIITVVKVAKSSSSKCALGFEKNGTDRVVAYSLKDN